MSPAFKEWHVIVEALGAGEQLLILRKGGLAEEHGEFRIKHDRFWLFPTLFHEQLAKTKPSAARYFHVTPNTAKITLNYWAEIVRSKFLTDWAQVAALDPHHLWTESIVRERFNWGHQPGLFALVVRIHQPREPITFIPTKEMAGCKSWVELPYDFATLPSVPVLDDEAFAAKTAAVKF